MSDLKINDVFNLPVSVVERETIFGRGVHVGYSLLSNTVASGIAAAHAINNHDKLTAQVADLRSALIGICDSPHKRNKNSVTLEVSEVDIDSAIKALEATK